MSTSADLVAVLKSELRDARITYAELAGRIGLAESSVKRMFARDGDMPLSRVDEICRVLGLDFVDLARRVADRQPLLAELTLEQEQAVVADRRLLLVAICCMSQWSAEQIVATYRMDAAECTGHLLRLDRLGIIELRPLNRSRLRVAKGFRWRANGPVMSYFRTEVLDDYFAGGFDGEAEMLTVVHGQIGAGLANSFRERLARVGEDFARQHIVDQKLPATQRRPYTLVIAMRSWLMAAFRDMKREEVAWPDAE